MATLALDIYGTLIDTNGALSQLQEWIGPQAEAFSDTWRNKQLEYSFRRGLMGQYQSFAVCTRHALDYCCGHYNMPLSGDQKDALLQRYRTLPAFPDVEDSLIALRADGHRLYAFSNGSMDAVEAVLQANELLGHLDGVVSCEMLETFKPNPDVYRYFMKQVDDVNDAWLVSGNSFDVIGAVSAGMKSAWVRRSERAVFDPWDIEPTVTVDTLSELCEKVNLQHAGGGPSQNPVASGG